MEYENKGLSIQHNNQAYTSPTNISVTFEVQYVVTEDTVIQEVLQLFRTSKWVRLMMHYISGRLKSISPVDQSVLQHLQAQRDKCQLLQSNELENCAICMQESTQSNVKMACGHEFHYDCLHTWLQLRNTCPICRFQYQKAYAGSYAVSRLTTTASLDEQFDQLDLQEICKSRIGRNSIQASVRVMLRQVSLSDSQREYPCEVGALLKRGNGEIICETIPVSAHELLESPGTPVASPITYDVNDNGQEIRNVHAIPCHTRRKRDFATSTINQAACHPTQQHERKRRNTTS